MFKKAVNNFFGWTYLKRVLTLTVAVAILVGFLDFFAFGIIQSVIPKQEVYSFFNSLATDVIKSKNTDFLEHLDSLDYLENLEGLEASDISEISKNYNVLNYYIVTKSSKDNQIKIELYGYHTESIVLVLSNDYKLISLEKHSITDTVPTPIFYLLFSVGIGFIVSNILNLFLMGLKWLVKYCSNRFKCFGHKNEITPKSEPENQTSKEDDDDKYSASDYEF